MAPLFGPYEVAVSSRPGKGPSRGRWLSRLAGTAGRTSARAAARNLLRPFAIFVLLAVLAVLFPFATVSAGQNAGNPTAAGQGQAGSNPHVQLEGKLEIIHEDFKNGPDRNLYWLNLPDGIRVPLQFVKEPPTHFLTGDHVRADGQLSGGSLILYSGSKNLTRTKGKTTTTSTSSIPVPNTFGPQYTLVILINFQDDAVQPYTAADAQNAFFGTANNFFWENSYGQTSITGDVVGWYTIPDSVTSCNMSQIATDAKNAAVAGGADLSVYTRYVYAFPYNSVCGWAGSSDVGGNPSESWINGNSLDIHIIDHELGHAFGLWHSHLLDCGTSATICSGGNTVEYGDLLDTMGVPQTASPDYNAFQKERLGWLNYGTSPTIETVTTSGTYTINTYEFGGPGPNALKVLKSTDSTTGAKTWYYLEARQADGFDAFLSNPTYYTQNETDGVLFHIGTDGNGNSSDLLDMTPATPTSGGWFNPSLAVGQSFQDSAAGVTFTTESVTSTGATVDIQFSGGGSTSGSTTQCTGTPSLAVASSQTSYNPGQTVYITATASCGGSPAANVSVSFVVTSTNGRQSTGSATTGSNGTATYKLKLRRKAPAGTYIAGSAVTIQGDALSASTQFTVQ